MLLTSRQIGQHCGIPERTIRDWQAKSIVPKTEDLAIAVQAIIAYYKTSEEQTMARADDDCDALTFEKVRLTRAQAAKVEMEIALKESQLVPATQVELVWSKYISACRARLLCLPARVALELSQITHPTLIQQTLQSAVDESLFELGGEEFVDGLGNFEANNEAIPAATATNR